MKLEPSKFDDNRVNVDNLLDLKNPLTLLSYVIILTMLAGTCYIVSLNNDLAQQQMTHLNNP